jgi:hypothetical protein
MFRLTDYPLATLVFCSGILFLTVVAGAYFGKRRTISDEERNDFGVILGAALTLLGLIIGFTFSMAISRYDQRKMFEEAEANAIGTEYVRADLLPATDAANVKSLLKHYLQLRIRFYQGDQTTDVATLQAQNDLWAAVRGPATTAPSPITALVVAGMNDVLNSQGYTQASWWNRIPRAAWVLMFLIAVCCTYLLGYSTRYSIGERRVLLVLPVLVSVAFFMIADIDAPRGGIIRVQPQNLMSLAPALQP